MHRRNLLGSVISIAAGAGLVTAVRADELSKGRGLGGPSEKSDPKHFIEASDGTRLFFREWGKGQPMVFAAPWGLNSAWWEYQMANLAGRGRRCVGLDRRGHGRSEEPIDGYDFDTLADDLAALLEQLDLRGVTLVGQSLGCGEVVRYLSRHGSSRVARIVLISTITPLVLRTDDNPDGVDRAVLENVRKTLSKERPHPVAAAAPAFFGAPKNAVSPEIVDWWVRIMVDGCSLRVMLDLHKVFTETDFRTEVRKISIPTLLIHGDIDTSAPLERTGRKTAALIPGAQLKVYEGAAHGLTFTHAEKLNADLFGFTNASR